MADEALVQAAEVRQPLLQEGVVGRDGPVGSTCGGLALPPLDEGEVGGPDEVVVEGEGSAAGQGRLVRRGGPIADGFGPGRGGGPAGRGL